MADGHLKTDAAAGMAPGEAARSFTTATGAAGNDNLPPAVTARSVWAAYDGPPVLVDVNLSLPAGELITVVGPNGAGKSTFFKLLVGMKRPVRGELAILDRNIDRQRRHSQVAYVPQEEHIDWDYPISVWDVVLCGRYGRMWAEGWRRFLPPWWAGRQHAGAVREALAAVDMLPYAGRPIGALSGGQKKRVFIARALAQDASLLLLDEPLVGVDRRSESLIFQILRGARDQGRTVIIVTHDLTSARRYSDRVVLINRTVIAEGPAETVLTHEHLDRAYGLDGIARAAAW